MGQVYHAEDTRLKRPVALKRMAPQLNTDEHYRRRFLKEAECASRLSHQHIAGIYDVFEDSGEIFLVMEFVVGETLRRRLRSPVSLDEAIDIAVQCAAALVAAQSQGIVHRDVKPENIMLTPSREVKILDFGVAKIMPRAEESTTLMTPASTGGMAGTPAYMAPESLLEKKADSRSDIFSLGVTLYEVCTGQHPFLADSFLNTAQRILHHTPPPANLLSPKVPTELARILNKMMSKDPAERYATSADLLVDLRALQRATAFPVLTPPAGSLSQAGALPMPAPAPVAAPAPPRLAEWHQKRGWGIWVSLGLIAVLASGACLFWPRLRPILFSLPSRLTSREASLRNVTGRAVVVPAPETTVSPRQNQPTTVPAENTGSLAAAQPAVPPAGTPGSGGEKGISGARPTVLAAAAAKSETRNARAIPGVGKINVTTNVLGARAVLNGPDGKSLQECVTPCGFAGLPPGRYTMDVTKPGYRRLLSILTVEANKIASENEQLERAQAELSIASDPPQAEVFVNGKRQPQLTPTTIGLAPGKYIIAVQKAGFGRVENSIKLKDEAIRGLRVRLLRQPQSASPRPALMGMVNVLTVPPGADIVVDGETTGHQTPFLLELPAGQHTLALLLKGYQAVQEKIPVEANQTLPVNKILNRL